MSDILIRAASLSDIDDILSIYNEGIVDRIATLETTIKDEQYMLDWLNKHTDRFKVIVAVLEGKVVGWASLNQYNSRQAYDGVADLSIYIKREFRGEGIGGKLLVSIEGLAKENDFHKIVLFTFPFNGLGQSLYKKQGFRVVGVFQNQGKLNGKFVDVMAMEKLLF
ncbi:arsinothricin resistance N-acetyltransferase ArsN1 family A [Neobacillus drentensis]|uniref:arsinothricin resistance N-acetyltransferase ArsN1 family A n=1 Tax=Neobacillus drentensis TaxID=220684 RepID=UPI00082451DA|nr:arsinothricin resistance N-acetyltransferase ArsN1 family A [Neobacillus drentensis]